MDISKHKILEIAALAKLALTENELQNLTVDLSNIVAYVDKINELNLNGVPETAHALDLNLTLREDVAAPSLPREQVLMNAPAHKNGYFSVPKVLEKTK